MRDDAVAREVNRLLVGARQVRRWTQQQLAEAVGKAYWRLFEKEGAIDAEYVSKLERGVITWPNARYRAAFRDVLGAATDAELGFYHRRAAATVDGGQPSDGEVLPVRRDEFIRLLTGVGAGAGLGVSGLGAALPDPVREVLALGATPADPPALVGRADVEQVQVATATFREWRELYGGTACREALAGQLRWAAGLLRGRAEDGLRRELHSAVGSLADVAGWNEVDAGHHDTALRCFRLGLHCAEEAQDWTLRAELLTDMSRQAVDRGFLDDATSLSELAQVRADRVAGTGRAIMSSNHARVLGAAGRVAECRDAVSAAEDYFADHQPLDESGESSFFQRANATDLALDNGSALFHAALRDPAANLAAIGQLQAALAQPDTISRRRRAMSTMKVATLELVHGDRDEGVALGRRALDLGDGVRSTRLTEDLRRLHTAANRHTGAQVTALRQQLDTVLTSA